MATNDRVEGVVRAAIVEALGLETDDEIRPETRLAELGADSMDLLHLSLDLEVLRGIDLGGQDEQLWQTVDDVVNAVRRRAS